MAAHWRGRAPLAVALLAGAATVTPGCSKATLARLVIPTYDVSRDAKERIAVGEVPGVPPLGHLEGLKEERAYFGGDRCQSFAPGLPCDVVEVVRVDEDNADRPTHFYELYYVLDPANQTWMLRRVVERPMGKPVRTYFNHDPLPHRVEEDYRGPPEDSR